MIDLFDVGVTYTGDTEPTIRNVDVHIPEGELALVAGRTGSGKSTLLRTLNGLVPHFSGGRLDGRVEVAGRDTRVNRPRDLADVVGFVDQNPNNGFVTDIVEDELAYAMESLGVPPGTMRRRVEEVLDILGLADIRQRALRTLSAGQKQRVAIGSVLTAGPTILVLDEPTSALDPQAAEEVLAVLQRLVHDLSMTMVMSEHRLERAVQYADRVLLVVDGTVDDSGDPAAAMAVSPVVPPVVELGRWASWTPLPLSIRDARRRAAPLRARLSDPRQGDGVGGDDHADAAEIPSEVVTCRRVSATYPGVLALNNVTLDVGRGEIVALMGRNGSGKSTLLRLMAGLAAPASGRLRIAGQDPRRLKGEDRRGSVGLIPQNPGDLLWTDSLGQECADADQDAAVASGTTAALLDTLLPGLGPQTHPGDLSEGQRLTAALAVILVGRPQLVLLDEPTRGLDYPTKARLVALLKQRADRGETVVVATHDVEFVAELASRVVILAQGEVVNDAPVRQAVVSSPVFAPQVAKVMAPLSVLTVAEVAALEARVGDWP